MSGLRLAVSCLIFWGGVIYFGLYIYYLRIRVRDNQTRKKLIHKKLSILLALFQKIIKTINNINVQWKHSEHAQLHPQIVIANHPTLIDALLIVAAFPHIICIYKKKLRKIPFLFTLLEELEYIPHDDDAFIEKALETIHQGKTLLIFPEGTRSGGTRVLPFSRGAATLAYRANCQIMPIIIKSSYPLLNKGIQWSATPQQIDIILELCYPISSFEGGQEDARSNEKNLTARLEKFYAEQLAR